jgi:hypothetical protein
MEYDECYQPDYSGLFMSSLEIPDAFVNAATTRRSLGGVCWFLSCWLLT